MKIGHDLVEIQGHAIDATELNGLNKHLNDDGFILILNKKGKPDYIILNTQKVFGETTDIPFLPGFPGFDERLEK